MIMLNITTKVAHPIVPEWLKWHEEFWKTAIHDTGLVLETHTYKLLEHDDEDGQTFVAQLKMASENDYDTFMEEFDELLRRRAHQRFGTNVISFRTLMKSI